MYTRTHLRTRIASVCLLISPLRRLSYINATAWDEDTRSPLRSIALPMQVQAILVIAALIARGLLGRSTYKRNLLVAVLIYCLLFSFIYKVCPLILYNSLS